MANPLNYASPNAAPARRRFGIGCLIALALLFIALGAIVWLLDVEFNRFPVTIIVVNESAAPLRDVVFDFGSRRWSVGTVSTRAALLTKLTLRGGGTLHYTVKNQNGSTFTGTAAAYLDSDCRGAMVGVRVNDAGASRFDP